MLELLTDHWVLMLGICMAMLGIGYLFHLKKKQEDANKRGIVIATTGCVGVIIVLFYIFGIIAAVCSIIGFLLGR